jgi:hypothetical protein
VTTNGIQKKTGDKRSSLGESVKTVALLRSNREELQPNFMNLGDAPDDERNLRVEVLG